MDLSDYAIALLVAWTIIVAAAGGLTVLYWPASGASTELSRRALLYSTFAYVPGAILLIEYLVRLTSAWLRRVPAIAPHDLSTLLPATVAIFVGPFLLIASFRLSRGVQVSRSFTAAREMNTLAWGVSTWATVLSLASV